MLITGPIVMRSGRDNVQLAHKENKSYHHFIILIFYFTFLLYFPFPSFIFPISMFLPYLSFFAPHVLPWSFIQTNSVCETVKYISTLILLIHIMGSKRSFYEDDELIITKPGYNAEMSLELKEQESAHGNISFVEGMGIRTTPYFEGYFNTMRLYVHNNLSVLSAELETQKSALANEWTCLRNKMDDIIVDPVIPDCVNVVFPVLVASVLVGRRSLPVRFLTTSVVFGLSVKYYMPNTYSATNRKLSQWGETNYPELWGNYQEICKTVDDLAVDLKKSGQDLKIELQKQIHEARLWIAKALDEN